MAEKKWKRVEREFAEFLGGIRVPVTGRQRGSAPDVEHPVFAVEIKSGAVMSSTLQKAVEQAVAASDHIVETEKIKKFPLVGIHQTRKGKRPQRYVMMRAQDFKEWMERSK